MISFLGFAAAAASLLGIFVGVSLQIIKNYQRKSCEGLSLALMWAGFLAYSIWAAYGFAKGDAFLEWSQTPGSILMFVVLVQFRVYGKNNSTTKN